MSKTLEDVLDALLKLFQGLFRFLHLRFVPPESIIPYVKLSRGAGRSLGREITAYHLLGNERVVISEAAVKKLSEVLA